ncbi:hypothetical protein JTE90_028624, partial [Oedothorax gibbosus]
SLTCGSDRGLSLSPAAPPRAEEPSEAAVRVEAGGGEVKHRLTLLVLKAKSISTWKSQYD